MSQHEKLVADIAHKVGQGDLSCFDQLFEHNGPFACNYVHVSCYRFKRMSHEYAHMLVKLMIKYGYDMPLLCADFFPQLCSVFFHCGVFGKDGYLAWLHESYAKLLFEYAPECYVSLDCETRNVILNEMKKLARLDLRMSLAGRHSPARNAVELTLVFTFFIERG